MLRNPRIASVVPSQTTVTPESTLTIAEFADLFGFTPQAVISAIDRQRQALLRPFYTFKQLATRWNCSPQNIYNVLRAHEAKALNLSGEEKRAKRLVAAETVARIERLQSKPLPHIE
jgi:hypothetical protein